MLIKITEKGWETYSSDLGTVPFENGVSTREVSRVEAMALGSFISIQEIDADGNELGQISPALEAVKMTRVTANVTAGLNRIQKEPSDKGEDTIPVTQPTEADVALAAARKAQADAERQPEPMAPAVTHTAESLQALADAKGIAGLREVAAPFGVKNTSVKGLMAEILAAQAKTATT